MAIVEVGKRRLEYDENEYYCVEGTEDTTFLKGTKREVFLTKGRDFRTPVYLGEYSDMEGLVIVQRHVFLIRKCDVAAIEAA